MALIQVDFISRCLHRKVTFRAIVPTDRTSALGYVEASKPFQTLYLLHGLWGNYQNWVAETAIVRWAEDRNLAVIMPSGENSFYIDNEARCELYGEFIGREIVEQTRALFPLSHKREDTFIAGLSMGGYGAVRNGLKYHETFSHIAALSSAFILRYAQTPEKMPLAVSGQDIFPNRSYAESVFGDLSKVMGSDMDYEALVKKLKAERADIPKIYLACGTEDYLIEENRAYRDFLHNEDVDFVYTESPGIHDWNFWNEYIEKVLDWLPLDEPAAQS